MSNKLKLFLGASYLIILVTFLLFLFLKLEFNRLNDFSYYKELQFIIEQFVGSNFLLNLLYFFIFSDNMDNTIGIWIPTFITIRNIFWKVDWIFHFFIIN